MSHRVQVNPLCALHPIWLIDDKRPRTIGALCREPSPAAGGYRAQGGSIFIPTRPAHLGRAAARDFDHALTKTSTRAKTMPSREAKGPTCRAFANGARRARTADLLGAISLLALSPSRHEMSERACFSRSGATRFVMTCDQLPPAFDQNLTTCWSALPTTRNYAFIRMLRTTTCDIAPLAHDELKSPGAGAVVAGRDLNEIP
jgi:hypothetical protein